MAHNYDDQANNPYYAAEHGGPPTSSSPRGNANASSNWFCHVCQADFVLTDEQVARSNSSPSCPSCGSEFVEQVAESADDPHDFDRVPDNPFAFFGGGPAHARPSGDGSGQDNPFGQQAGPFAALMQQMLTGMMHGPLQHHPAQGPQFRNVHQEHERPSSTPPDPARAAAQAAERRAAGQTPNSPLSQPDRPSSSSGVYRSGGTTFIWNNSNSSNRPPPQPSGSRMQSEPGPGGGRDQQEQVPVRNLASFLSEAFRSSPVQTPQHEQADNQARSYLQEGPGQAGGNDRPGGGFPGDPLSAFLSQLAGDMGVPLGTPDQEQQPTSPQQHAQQGQRQPGGPRAARVFMTRPGGGGGLMTFTFGTGNGGEGAAEGGGMQGFPFIPFLMGGQGGNAGQMGDYVFSQGALDNIITELMNQANGRYGPQPAPEEVVNNLPKVTMTKELLANDSIQDCAVCKDQFEEKDEALTLPCHHLFHEDCIKPWLERSGTCPVCRYQLVEQPEPPRGPGEGAATAASARAGPPGETPTSPISPGTARSPPIEGGSSMPGSFGGFPFGRIFSTIGNLMTGGSSSSTDASASASGRQRDNASQQQSGRGQTSSRQTEEPRRDRPDMEDLDLD